MDLFDVVIRLLLFFGGLFTGLLTSTRDSGKGPRTMCVAFGRDRKCMAWGVQQLGNMDTCEIDKIVWSCYTECQALNMSCKNTVSSSTTDIIQWYCSDDGRAEDTCKGGW
ncbi:hypothetical protein Slin15195_G101700 [Septoria linicola]|uniref:Uncharacterized protein n=1 Tax=Septoria linicola TaxID=215465 RepID=A0A9Q9EMI7_9PEZI|nr:hypothetical protein Slin15195_G101700 [Septoria linicola]